MKVSKSSTQKESLKSRNADKANFAKFLESLKEKQEKINAEVIANRKAKRPKSTNFAVTSNVILLIFNAGEKGITVGEIMKQKPLQYSRKNKATNEMEIVDSFSIDTVSRDWNVKNKVIQYRNQKLIDKGFEVYFEITPEKKASNLTTNVNHRITLHDAYTSEVLRFLKGESNFNESWLNRK